MLQKRLFLHKTILNFHANILKLINYGFKKIAPRGQIRTESRQNESILMTQNRFKELHHIADGIKNMP